MEITLSIFAALAIAVTAAFAVRAICRSPVAGAALVGLLLLAEAGLVEMPQLKTDISLYPHDFACALFAVAGLLRLMWTTPLKTAHIVLVGLCGCFLFSLLRGINEFGLQPSGNESRATAYALCAAFYFMTFSYDQATCRRLIQLMLACACGLAGLAVFRWAAILTNFPVPANWADVGGGKAIRVLNASQALFMCQAAMLAAMIQFRARRWFVCVLALIVLVLQHRSVWIAGAIGAAWLYCRSSREARFNWRTAVPFAIAAVVVLCLIVLITGNSFLDGLQDSVIETTRDHSTLAWRVAGWEELLTGHAQLGLDAWFFGQPFGAGFRRVIAGILSEQAPHSYVVLVILRMGAAGAVMLFGAYGMCLNRLHRGAAGGYVPLLQAWLVTQIVYFAAYSPGMEQGALLGIAIACVSLARSPARDASFPGRMAIATA